MWDKPVNERTAKALRKLGRQVRGARWHSGLSQRDVEARTGIDQTTIVRIEQGRATGLPLRRFALLLDSIGAGVATRRPPLLFGMASPDSVDWINDGPAWENAVGPDPESDDDDLLA